MRKRKPWVSRRIGKKYCVTNWKHRSGEENRFGAFVLVIFQQLRRWNFQYIGNLIVVLVVLVAALVFWQATVEPEQCALCGGLKRHAPCIINLSTGEVGELVIYEPHPTLVGEIAKEQTGGTLEFFPCVGQKAVCDTGAKTCSTELPESHKRLKTKYFCPSCRELVKGMESYALVDLYNLNNIQIYPIKDGGAYGIREYTVSITVREGKLLVEACGERYMA